MTVCDNNKISFSKESNKLVGAPNSIAWKKRTDLNLIENEVMDHIKGSITQPPKEDNQAYARFMKGEVRDQRILIESIKDFLISYVSKLDTAKAIYDKLVELFSVSTEGEVISLTQEFCKLKMSEEDGIASFSMRISEIRDQLQELVEVMSDREMTIMVLNALPEEWGNFTSSLHGKKETTPFEDLWSLCKIEETKLNAKVDGGPNEQNQAYAAMTRRKWKFGNFSPQKKRRNMDKVRCYGCKKLGHYRRDCPKRSKDKRNREEAHITEEVKEPETRKCKNEEVKDLYYD